MVRRKKEIQELLHSFRENKTYQENVAYWKTIPPKEANSVPFPLELDESIKKALLNRGISSLYSHQKSAFDSAIYGENVVAVTPTASDIKSYTYDGDTPAIVRQVDTEKNIEV